MGSLPGIQVYAIIKCEGSGRIILQECIFKYRYVHPQAIDQREILFNSPFVLNKESQFQILRTYQGKWTIWRQCIRKIVSGSFN